MSLPMMDLVEVILSDQRASVNAMACRHTLVLEPTAQASSRHRCVIGGNVLEHHDAGAVIPLHADPARCLDQVHAACVLHKKRVMGKGKSHRSVVHRHLRTDGGRGTVSSALESRRNLPED